MNELQQHRTKLLAQSEDIRLKYAGKAETMSATEQVEWSNIIDEIERIDRQIELAAKSERASEAEKLITEPMRFDGAPSAESTKSEKDRLEGLRLKAYGDYLHGVDIGWKNLPAFQNYEQARVTSRAYQSENPAGGGFAVLPEQLVGEFLTLMKDKTFMRQNAHILSVPRAESLGIPAIDTDPSDTDWTAELGTGSEETTAALGKRELRPWPMAKRIKLSKKLLRQVPDFTGVIMDRLTYKAAITEEKGFLTGNGVSQPLGVFTASVDGIPTTQDVSTATTGVIVADDLINVKYSLKQQYAGKSAWIINRALVKAIRQLKDTTNNYIWTTAVGPVGGLGPGNGLQGTPETLLGQPVYMSEYAPSATTSGSYLAVFGDLDFYWIADALDMQIDVLYELYAEKNQMGYILRKETDGMPVMAEAFARLKSK